MAELSFKRRLIQLASALIYNAHLPGFVSGKIYSGTGKGVCVPGLNCYSCPGALGSCPIGALQAVAGGGRHKISFYVLGTLMLFGTLLGRLICGLLCPFGFVQDILYKIPSPKINVPEKADKFLRYIKYAVLLIFVMILPAFAVNEFGIGEPWFCKYICPAGTLEGGLPLVLLNEKLRGLAGNLFSRKVGVMIFMLAGAVFIGRSFCRYFCPLGAFYSLFNKFSIYRMNVDEHKCISCGKCEKICPMAVKVTRDINCGECIRCGKCRAACPTDAITGGFDIPINSKENIT